MALSLPYPNSPQDGDAFLSLPVRSNVNAITQAIQSFDGSQVQAGSIAAAALAPAANPITRGNETLGNFLQIGCAWSAGGGLLANMTAGTAYINGVRVSILPVTGKVLTINTDTYVDVDTLGNLYYLVVANAAASPGLTGNAIRIAKLTTNATVFAAVVQGGVDSLFNPIRPFSPLNLISSVFGGQVQTYTNAGAGSGTGYYINLGGIKLVWGAQGSAAIPGIGPNSTTAAQTVSYPAGFFTTVQFSNVTLSYVGSAAQQYISGSTFSVNGSGFFITNNSAATVQAGISWFAIGT